MAISQINFYVPDEILAGLETGEYIQYGGVVRDKVGKIVCFLEEAGRKIIRKPKLSKGKVVLIVGAGVVATGILLYVGGKLIMINTNLNKELKTYLESIKNGNLTITNVMSLKKSLNELKRKHVPIYIKSNIVFDLLENYTKELATSNKIHIPNEKMKTIKQKKSLDRLIDLIDIQSEMFEMVSQVDFQDFDIYQTDDQWESFAWYVWSRYRIGSGKKKFVVFNT